MGDGAPELARGRGAFLGLVLRHAVAAGRLRLRASLSRTPPPWEPGRPLRVAFLSPYPAGHYGTVARFSRWLPHLARKGVEATLLCPRESEEFGAAIRGDPEAAHRFHRLALEDQARNIATAARADVAVLHRGALPLGPWQRPDFERALSSLNPRLVYDFYDSIWVRRREHHALCRSAVARWLNPPDVVERILTCARTVTVTGEHLAQFARLHHPDVRIVPMMLDAGDYPVKEHRETDRVVFGWMGNAGNLTRLLSIAGALRRLAAARSIVVRVVTSKPVEIPGVPVESIAHPWSRESEIRDLLSFDAGLLPTFEDEYDRGKFPFKSLQYAAAGLPFVATPAAMDTRDFVDGRSILYARSEDEWFAAMDRLAADASARASLGRGAREVLESNFTFAAHAEDYAAMLREVASKP